MAQSKIILVGCFSAFCAASFGQTAFSNLGTSPVGGWLITNMYSPIVQFTSAVTGELSGFTVDVNGFGNPGSAFTLNLYADNGSNVPDATPLAGGFVGIPNGGYVSISATGATLVAGKTYWLQATATGGTDVWWVVPGAAYASTAQNFQGDPDPEGMQTPGSPDFTAFYGDQAIMGVYVTPLTTPEPAPGLALGVGVLGLAGIARRRRRR